MSMRSTRLDLLPLFGLALLAVALGPGDARADCSAGALWAWPPAETALPLEPMILLDAYGDRRDVVASLAQGGLAALVGKDHTAVLKVDALHVGTHAVSQAVLRPAEPLRPGTRYALHVQRLDRLVRGEAAPAIGPAITTWSTATRDLPTLSATGHPKVGQPSYVPFGCGPASHMHVEVPATSGVPIAVEVRLAEAGGAVTTYVVPMQSQMLSIGHDMCSGPFDVTGARRRFEATLTVRDAAGQRATPRSVTFDGVRPIDQRPIFK